MKLLKKLVALAAVTAVMGSSINTLNADQCATISGCGYQECCASPCLTPAIALGAVAVVAIAAVALQNTHGHSNHSHVHSK